MDLRELRESKLLSARDVARQSGIDASTLSRIERGLQKPYPATLRKLAAVYKVRLDVIADAAKITREGKVSA